MAAYMRLRTYEAIDTALGKNKTRVKVGNNTYASRSVLDNGDIEVRYHGNCIVTLHTDGTMTLSDCGWQTSTTKERLNQFAPRRFALWQKNYEWFWATRDDDYRPEIIYPWPGKLRVDQDGREVEPEQELEYA